VHETGLAHAADGLDASGNLHPDFRHQLFGDLFRCTGAGLSGMVHVKSKRLSQMAGNRGLRSHARAAAARCSNNSSSSDNQISWG